MRARSSRPRSPTVVAQDDAFVWFDASEPTDEDIAALGQAFDLHPLTLEDIGHRRQRPRVELFEDYALHHAAAALAAGDDLTEHEVHAVVGQAVPRRPCATAPIPSRSTRSSSGGSASPSCSASDPGGFAVYVLFDEVGRRLPHDRRAAGGHGRRPGGPRVRRRPLGRRAAGPGADLPGQARGGAAAPVLLADAPGARPAPGAARARRRRAAAVLPRRDGARDPRVGARRQHPRPADLAAGAAGRAGREPPERDHAQAHGLGRASCSCRR